MPPTQNIKGAGYDAVPCIEVASFLPRVKFVGEVGEVRKSKSQESSQRP